MNFISTATKLVGGIGLMAILAACSTTKQTENLLSEAGFKVVAANTPQQQAHLQKLPAGKVTRVKRQGKTFYAYPDAARQVLYVGTEAQYQQYQVLCHQHESSSPGLSDAEIDNEPGWGPWGGWGMPWE